MGEDKGRVLIVDDEAMLLDNLARAAREEGYRVDVASNGKAAWALLADQRFDLVVTDLRMPEMDGPALMDRISELPTPPRVIAITGYASLESAVDCLRKGATDFLVKPFEVEEFLESLRKAISQVDTVFRDPDWDEVAERYGLTRRQVAVLRAFYSTGKTNRQIAEDLFLSPHTVKSHIRASFDKLGVTSRAQLLRALQTDS